MRGHEDDIDMETPKEDEIYLQNHWKLVATAQFFNLFKNLFKLRDAVTPYDLEQSLLRPQYDPLVGDLISRLINKKYLKSGPVTSNSSLAYFGVNDGSCADYEEWNVNLAKRFSAMFKTFKKFSLKYFAV